MVPGIKPNGIALLTITNFQLQWIFTAGVYGVTSVFGPSWTASTQTLSTDKMIHT
jgi:hypothetical protein